MIRLAIYDTWYNETLHKDHPIVPRENSRPESKDVRRRHFDPLTDGSCRIIYLDLTPNY